MGQTSSCQSLPHFLCVLLQPGFRLQVLTDPGRQLLVSPDLSTAHSTTIVKQASNFRFALFNLYLVEDPDLSTAHSTTIVKQVRGAACQWDVRTAVGHTVLLVAFSSFLQCPPPSSRQPGGLCPSARSATSLSPRSRLNTRSVVICGQHGTQETPQPIPVWLEEATAHPGSQGSVQLRPQPSLHSRSIEG